MSFGELCVLVIVAIVVIGPKDMPKVLRKAGLLAGRLRRMATDVREQSGIDEVLRADGLHEDIAEIRKLAQADFLSPAARRPQPAGGSGATKSLDSPLDTTVVREREFPRDGADCYGSLPDTAIMYAREPKLSPLARDPLYVNGDRDAPVARPEAAEAKAADAVTELTPAPEAGSPAPAGQEPPGAPS